MSVNDIIDPARIDELSGTSALTGQPVEVTRGMKDSALFDKIGGDALRAVITDFYAACSAT